MKCNLCRNTVFRNLITGKRLMQHYIERFGLFRSMRIFHFAPETDLVCWQVCRCDYYVKADFELVRYSHSSDVQFVDLTESLSYERFCRNVRPDCTTMLENTYLSITVPCC